MAVNDTHEQYEEMAPKWKRCRDVASGQDAVHAAGADYLPRLHDQTEEDYEAYKLRATFFNATWRTIAGLCGMVFSKPYTVEVPNSVEPLLETVTADGLAFSTFAMQSVTECLTVGREGILVDYPTVPEDRQPTQADAQLLNLRPTLARYRTEAILNWKEEVLNNRKVLTQVRLAEEREIQVSEFETKKEEVYRVLDLVPGEDGLRYYRQRLFRLKRDESGTLTEEQIGGDIYPTMGGKRMEFIPFYPLGVDDVSISPDEPPLMDLVDLNLAHYRVSADYEHGCHFTGLPTGYITGYTKDTNEKIYLGSQEMLIFPNEQASCGFLEFTGQGLSALEKNLERKEQQMAILGARMLEAPKKAAEAVGTAAIHRSGENSLLSRMAQSVSQGLRSALQTFSDWAGGSGEVRFALNKDFLPAPLSAQDLAALVSAWQTGAISKEVLFERLKRGEVIAEDKDFEVEEAKIANDVHLPNTGADTLNGGQGD